MDTSVRELLPPPPLDRECLNVLYLGNHGESQRLDLVIQAAALSRDYVRLTMVGHGVQRRQLRNDWQSFDITIPSKTYEILAVGRHVTAVLRGEARRVIEESGAGDVVAADPEAIAALWKDLHADRSRLVAGTSGRQWLEAHADLNGLSAAYADLLRSLTPRRNAS
ncbi:glycosyltransferase family protein [Arthrobacter zhaoxinii]|uniref:hypothetical protein n=1 Tax=Arthrobacter zhaoxinii TaxID=2964616 RepID=UPI002102508D|nr:hypothetical protein [Arthrobacter zhaoxinii]MCQ2000404.1 hypothetical protein [Arthrobacter zhaoxinii]